MKSQLQREDQKQKGEKKDEWRRERGSVRSPERKTKEMSSEREGRLLAERISIS